MTNLLSSLNSTLGRVAEVGIGLTLVATTALVAPAPAEAKPLCSSLTSDPGTTCLLAPGGAPGTIVGWDEWQQARQMCFAGQAPAHMCRVMGVF